MQLFISRYRQTVVCVALIFAGIALASFQVDDHAGRLAVPYPDGYREWSHVKTAIVEQGNPAFTRYGGFHHIYANQKAMEGYRTGHFPNGAVLVFDVLEVIETNKLLLEGKRRQLDVMVKDSLQYADTGGWGFEEFEADSKTKRTVGDRAASTCYSCHANKSTLVFSEWRP